MGREARGSVPLFQDLPAEDIAWLERLGKTESFLSGENLFCGRARLGTLFVLLQGTAEVMLPDPISGEE